MLGSVHNNHYVCIYTYIHIDIYIYSFFNLDPGKTIHKNKVAQREIRKVALVDLCSRDLA